MVWKIADRCSNCKKLKEKHCKGISFSIEVISLYCKKYEQDKGGK